MWLAAAAAAVVLLVLAVRRRGVRAQHAARIPGPPTLPLLGNAHLFMCAPEDLMSVVSGLLQKYGDVIRFWLGPDLNVVVADPDDLKMLLSSTKTSVKGPSYKYMAEFIGGGILSGSGPAWRRHRKIASPNYGKRAIESYERVFSREAGLLVAGLRRDGGAGRERDVYRPLVRTTSYAVCQTLMALTREQSVNLPHLHDLINSTDRLYTAVFNRMSKWWYQVNLFYRFTSSYAFSKTFKKMQRAFSGAIIEHRRKALAGMGTKSKLSFDTEEDSLKNTELGVIDRFILSNELDADELIHETYTIFTSSQEASAKISSFMLLMLAYHPEYQDRLYAEITGVLGARPEGGEVEGAAITASDLRRMEYLDRVFRECVRLFPIGALIQRTITEDFQISKYTLPAGCSLVAPIFQMSRDPRYWERPDHFYPDHFTPESVASRPANCYLPFSVGPMDCLGRYFGTKLIKTIVVGVVREFKLTSNQTYDDLKLKIAVSVVPKDGFKLILNPRVMQVEKNSS